MRKADHVPPLLVFSDDYAVKKRLAVRELSNDYKGKIAADLPIAFESRGIGGKGDRAEIRMRLANKRIGGKPLEECEALTFIEIFRKPFESYAKFVRRVFDTVVEKKIGHVEVQYDTPKPKPVQWASD